MGVTSIPGRGHFLSEGQSQGASQGASQGQGQRAEDYGGVSTGAIHCVALRCVERQYR